MSVTISGTTGIDAGSLPVANTGKISAGSGLPVILNTAGVDRVTVDTAGNVGIGTSSPNATSKIHAVGSQQSIRIESTIASDAVFRSTTTLGDWGAGTGIGAATNEYSIYNFYNGFKALSIGSTGNINVVTGGLVVSNSNAELGYGTGAGGTVTQLTSKNTTVTLNKPSGTIYTHNESLAAGASVSFPFGNNLLDGYTFGDILVVNGAYTPTTINPDGIYRIEASMVGSGGGRIRITNLTGAARAEVLAINFSIVKGARV